MFKILLLTALFAAASSTLMIGKHYTAEQGGDRIATINRPTKLADLGGWDNDMSRFKIIGGETWEFYDSNDFSGEPLWVSTGPQDWTRVDQIGLGDRVNDRVSSVKIAHAPKLYIGLHYTASQEGDRVLGINQSQDLKDGWSNNLSRFKIIGGETWEFYDSADFSGEPLFTKTGPLDWTRVDQIGFGDRVNDRVSSVKLVGQPGLLRLINEKGVEETEARTVRVPAGSIVQVIRGDWICRIQ